MTDAPNATATRLTGEQIDNLRRLTGYGIDDAIRSLGQLTRTQVEGTSVRAHVASAAAIGHLLEGWGSSSPPAGDGAELGFAAHFTVDGVVRLRQLIHFTPDGARLLSGLLVGSAHPRGTPLSASSLAEACNILVSSFAGGVASAAGLRLVPSVPHVEAGPLPNAARAAFAGLDEALLLVSDLRLPGVRWAGRIVTAPEPESLGRMLALAQSSGGLGPPRK